MAECKSCGKTYFSKECPHCNDEVISQKRNTSFQDNMKKEHVANTVLGKNKTSKFIPAMLMTLVAIIIMVIVFQYNSNPLIGKWRGNVTLLGTQTIEFRSDRMIFMGMTSKVEYEKSGNEVIVTDATGMGIIYKIIDKNTIFCNMAGMKAVYKRIK